MLRDARAQAVVALVALALAAAQIQARRSRADPQHMSKPSAVQQVLEQAIADLQPGALIAFDCMPAGARLVEIVDFTPETAIKAVHGLDLRHSDMPIVLTLGQVYRGYTIVQPAPTVTIPNVLSEADLDLLRTRVDQRG